MRTPAETETLSQPEMYKFESQESEAPSGGNQVVLSPSRPETHIFTNR